MNFRSFLAKIVRNMPFYRELLRIRADINALRSIEAARFLLEMEKYPRYQDPKRLLRYAFSVNSQGGEDGIIHEIFNRIGVMYHLFVEIGVGNGIENNTAFLLSQGWSGYWVDASQAFLRTLKRHSLQDRVKYKVAFVTRENICQIFKELAVPKEFDLLSVDVDQNTYYIWEALQEYSPRVVVVEYNAGIMPDIDWKVRYQNWKVWDGSKNFGAGLQAFELLGVRLGYCLVGCSLSGVNAFFVRKDLVGDRFAAPFTAENHYEPPRYFLCTTFGHPRTILDSIEHGK